MSHEEDTPDEEASPLEPASTDADRQPIRYTCDGSDSPSMAVVEAVAAATDRDQTALPPLHGYVDADALDALLTGGPNRGATPSRADGHVRVSFAYDGVEVTARSDGRIEVRPDDGPPERARAGPQTAADLEAHLLALFRAARRNEVSVTGGWAIRNGPDQPDWDVHVTRIAKSDDEDAHGQS